mgnify:CR=1 FL=1
MDKQTVRDYWQTFQDSLPPGSAYIGRLFLAEGWGDSPQMADELGGLIAAGIKTATCSAVWEWQAEGQDWPAPGAITVVLDGRDEPLCIVETIEVTVRSYNQVDADFASAEGEGDRSLAYWREAHRSFFSRSLTKIGRQFAEDMPLVCERFKLIYP